ncbi:MAG TPA: sugar kinase [Gemmatimonadaceae bacterium]|nr:sugar kinase [Gemmatimonadaceae bacterium]
MDLVTFGEGLIRLSPAPPATDAHSAHLAAYVAGSELNVAVAAAHLAVSTRWISRLPDTGLGHFLDATARAHGVDTRIEWAQEGRVGVYFLTEGSAPRQSGVVYDRAGSAFSLLAEDSLEWPSLLRGARWFHMSGITPALSESAAAMSADALGHAKEAGLTVSYDVNYRGKLWDAKRAREVQEPLMRHVDVLIVSRDDARIVFGVSDASAESVARALAERFGIGAVVVTDRDAADGTSAAVVADGVASSAPLYAVDVVERVGTGDAFTAGLIVSRIQNQSWADAVRLAAASAALKLTMRGDFFTGRRSDIDNLVQRHSAKAGR